LEYNFNVEDLLYQNYVGGAEIAKFSVENGSVVSQCVPHQEGIIASLLQQ